MRTKPGPSADASELRRRAEERMREQNGETDQARTDADTQRLVHELQVHQIELEMQNAELGRARADTEAALERITDLYDFAPVGYLTVDHDGTILEVNLAGAALLGMARSAMMNRRFGQFVSPADRPAFDGFLERVLSRTSRERCEISLLREGKPPVPVELEAIVSGSSRTCRVALTDLTERNRAAEDRLILGKLESTGNLAGGIAHDFNNLLTAIILNLDLAQALAPASAELASCLADAKKSAWMARGLTKQLLTFSRGSAPIRKVTALPKLIREFVRPALSGSRVRCEFSFAADLWPAWVDEGQVGQVVRNMVLNAREAMPEGGVISIRVENAGGPTQAMPALPPGDYVRVSIADEGAGISSDDLPRVFDPYFSTKQRGSQKGMGLGLTICHMIVQKHGGAIAVKSVPGKGSTFDICLPAAPRSALETDAPVPRWNPRQKCRILVMDDDEMMRQVCGRALVQMGHFVELVENGRMAIEACETAKKQDRPFDVALLGLTIRDGMGARETISALRQVEPHAKAIVMTGYADDPVLDAYRNHGFDGALLKPFDIGSLREVLSRVLGSEPDLGTAP